MNYNILRAKYLTKKLEGYEKRIKQMSAEITKDKSNLKKTLNKLSQKENIKYGYQLGFIDKKTYKEMLEAIKNE